AARAVRLDTRKGLAGLLIAVEDERLVKLAQVVRTRRDLLLVPDTEQAGNYEHPHDDEDERRDERIGPAPPARAAGDAATLPRRLGERAGAMFRDPGQGVDDQPRRRLGVVA